jgi:hypothetical protein
MYIELSGLSNVSLGCFLIYGVIKGGNPLLAPTEILLIYVVQLFTAAQSSGSFYL